MSSMNFQQRLQWSLDMQQKHAVPYYHELWDIDEIVEIDVLGANNAGAKILDYSGLDKVIRTKEATIHLGQRFRQRRPIGSTDFSIRVKTYGDEDTEWDKLERNYKKGYGWLPSLYGFGIAPQGGSLKFGFHEFYLIDMEGLLEAYFDGSLEPIGDFSNGDGSKGRYFDLDELRRRWLIVASFGGGPDGE